MDPLPERRRADPPGTGGVGPLVERLDGGCVLVVLSIVFLSFADAAFTLTLLGTGKVLEWNPLMAHLIETDVQLFATVKMVLTSGGVVVLAAFSRERILDRVPVRSVLLALLGSYLALTVYHLFLLGRVGLLLR